MPDRPRKKSSLLIFIFLFVPISLGWGRASGIEDLVYKGARPMKKIFETQKKGAEEAATKAGEKTYYYDPTGKTDPFKSFIAEQEAMEEKRVRKPKTYLETLELSQLSMNGNRYSLESTQWSKQASSTGKKTATKVGVGTELVKKE